MGFSREEYWSGLPFPSPGDHPDPGIEPLSPAAPALAASLPLSHLGSPRMGLGVCYFKDGTQPGPSVLVVTYDPYGATSGASLHFFFFYTKPFLPYGAIVLSSLSQITQLASQDRLGLSGCTAQV